MRDLKLSTVLIWSMFQSVARCIQFGLNKMKRQVAAIPIVIDQSGDPMVMLMTSRETKRWVIPKGWPIKGLKPHKAAEREAYEEAGVVGDVAKKPIGSYDYLKRLGSVNEPCAVTVYLMSVRAQLPTWPEQGERDIEQVSLAEAADRVQEAGLKAIFKKLADSVDLMNKI